ncbi:Ycf49-like protein [Gracilariopsis chorda]|uniref:Ycf49-like protein n=1 Tax=Gracilariopsis chorda TaxID=448386 RepID=A0A2V3IH42_9FLOR|nr:Ycf49-like protein [Gracilariopsis chorda]|eukprot:PXF41372.1 Ycf49-like protein [Gracilariopsis chorda]
MLVDPWSVSAESIDALAAQFFAASLFPYLAFLYLLNRKQVNCPPLANFGFRFLLVFVFATIPAGIYAKTHYHDILANVDWLHGSAESLLTITNLLIVLGFRQASGTEKEATTTPQRSEGAKVGAQMVPTLLLLLGAPLLGGLLATVHEEPANALSFPTWIIHVSSLVEWLVAMGLVWEYSERSRNERWKGLTWGMVPLHTSGICACTYHLFYNAPSLSVLVLLQAALTFVGNCSMAFATCRIGGQGDESGDDADDDKVEAESSLMGFEDMGTSKNSNLMLLGKVFALSAMGSAGVKWGSLLFDAPFSGSLPLALTLITVPTALNVVKWASRR